MALRAPATGRTGVRPPLHVGGTPLYAYQVGESGRLWIKDDSRMPSGSLKDRASAMAVALARASGMDTVATASTGNAAAALACMCAVSGLRAVIFAPADAAPEKLFQIRAFGAEVILVDGTYDDAFTACYDACLDKGWYNRSTGLNCFMAEGKKTISLEIFEQLGGSVPDTVFVPVGNGGIIAGVYKGFYDLLQLGWIEKIPRIFAVQAQGSNFVYRAWRSGRLLRDVPGVAPTTSAGSVAVSLPKDRLKAMRAIRESQGEVICVSDDEIYDSVYDLAGTKGIFAEPGGAAAYAGWRKSDIGRVGASAVVLVTGSGLKDTNSLSRRSEKRTRDGAALS